MRQTLPAQVDELKARLDERGLSTTGIKADLVRRLKEAEQCDASWELIHVKDEHGGLKLRIQRATKLAKILRSYCLQRQSSLDASSRVAFTVSGQQFFFSFRGSRLTKEQLERPAAGLQLLEGSVIDVLRDGAALGGGHASAAAAGSAGLEEAPTAKKVRRRVHVLCVACLCQRGVGDGHFWRSVQHSDLRRVLMFAAAAGGRGCRAGQRG